MIQRMLSPRIVFFLAAGLIGITSCKHTPLDSTSSSSQQEVTTVPADLQETVNALVHAVETVDIPTILAAYAEDFRSGAGRTKDGSERFHATGRKSREDSSGENDYRKGRWR